jgi:stearoyl-CoA desaturase (delta-9 desaturase)
MKQYGHNFFLVFLPFHVFGLIGLYYSVEYFWTLFLMWFFIGVVGNGVAAHRYFAHNSFKCALPVRWVLGILATLGAIGPLSYWVIQHSTHHAKSDKDTDPHASIKGMWYSMYSWSFPQGSNEHEYLKERYQKRLAVDMSRDKFFTFFLHNHYKIIYAFCMLLLLINPIYFFLYCLAYCIDFLRLGLINYVCHNYGYRNHNTSDKSTNNIILGLFGFGFGWHNNHHANPGKLILTERWWEIDIEGYIGRLLSLTAKKS